MVLLTNGFMIGIHRDEGWALVVTTQRFTRITVNELSQWKNKSIKRSHDKKHCRARFITYKMSHVALIQIWEIGCCISISAFSLHTHLQKLKKWLILFPGRRWLGGGSLWLFWCNPSTWFLRTLFSLRLDIERRTLVRHTKAKRRDCDWTLVPWILNYAKKNSTTT